VLPRLGSLWARRSVRLSVSTHTRDRSRVEPVGAWRALVGPGEMSLVDAHYGGHARVPARAIRPRTPAEIAFLSLGPVASAFLRAAAASGTSRLGGELALIADLERSHGREPLLAALERALAHRRFRAADVRSILAAGAGVPRHREPGAHLVIPLPAVPVRPLAAYALEPAS